ncbi:MAG: hypothetical protein WCP16_07065 [Pseudanabaena sp. ELA645]
MKEGGDWLINSPSKNLDRPYFYSSFCLTNSSQSRDEIWSTTGAAKSNKIIKMCNVLFPVIMPLFVLLIGDVFLALRLGRDSQVPKIKNLTGFAF